MLIKGLGKLPVVGQEIVESAVSGDLLMRLLM
jgi:hypothetical protein